MPTAKSPHPVDQLPTQPKLVRHAAAETVSLSPTNHFRVLFDGCPGAPEFFSEEAAAGDGPPRHRHPWATWETIVDGRVEFLVGEQRFELGPGDAIYTPPNTVHAYRVLSANARLVGFNYPARSFFDLQRQAAPIFAAQGPPDMGAIRKLAAEHEVEVLGPPLEPGS